MNGAMGGGDATRRRVLVIDTATESVVTGIAQLSGVGEPASVLASRAVRDHRRHAELLTTLIAETLDESDTARDDLAAVIVGCGPGPFTGLRVGMATGAAFADALDIPAHGVCTLDAIAADVRRIRPEAATVLTVTDARRREVYWAVYGEGDRCAGPGVDAPAVLAGRLAAGPAVDAVGGSPAHLALAGWDGPVSGAPHPSVAALAEVGSGPVLAGALPESLTPLYLRRPDAVERAQPRRDVGVGSL